MPDKVIGRVAGIEFGDRRCGPDEIMLNIIVPNRDVGAGPVILVFGDDDEEGG